MPLRVGFVSLIEPITPHKQRGFLIIILHAIYSDVRLTVRWKDAIRGGFSAYESRCWFCLSASLRDQPHVSLLLAKTSLYESETSSSPACLL